MTGPQIVVVGLGAAGSAALYQLARRGVRTIGIEQFALGHDRGSSHGPTRIIRLAHFENESYVPLMRRAYALWHELENIAGEKLLHITSLLEIGPEHGTIVQGTLAAVRKHDLNPEILDASSVMRRYPAYKLPPDYKAILQPDGGYIEAARALATMLRAAEAAGAAVRTGEKVVKIEPRAHGVRVITNYEEIDAAGVVVAAGPWMKALMPELRLPLTITRQVVGWFEPRDATQFTEDRFPVFILESQYGNHYGFPSYGRAGVKIAKHHHLGQEVDPDTYSKSATEEDEAAIREPLLEYLPGANVRLLAAQTCLYTMTPDGTFIIDRMPGCPNIVVASPCCGHGFKFSPVIGEILADLATRGTTASDISQFRLQRFAKHGSD